MPKSEKRMDRVVQDFQEGVQKQNEEILSVATGISEIFECIPENAISYARDFLMVSRLLKSKGGHLDYNTKANLKVTYDSLARRLGEYNIWPIASRLGLWNEGQNSALVENKKFIPQTSD